MNLVTKKKKNLHPQHKLISIVTPTAGLEIVMPQACGVGTLCLSKKEKNLGF